MNILEEYQKEVVDQIEKEYQYSNKSLRSKVDEWLFRLKVYNNQKRQKDKVGDPLLFTVFQTIFASLYDDGLQVEFLPREEGDIDIAENINQLATFDQDEMKKDEIDYAWLFDTLFFSRGIVSMMEYDFERQCPVPENWSQLTMLRDPDAVSVNGNANGKGACRFIGREVYQKLWELKDNPAYFNLDKIEEKAGSKDQSSLIEKKEDARREALGLDKVKDEDIGDNRYLITLQWFTFVGGERYFVELANERRTVIRFQKLKDQDSWPLVDKALFPIANSWDGVSVPDLVEDKQRARAVLLNAGLDIAKANSAPMYFFDVNRIKRRDQLNFEFNKFVPVEGNPRDAAVPMLKDQLRPEVQYIFTVLDESVQRALATPELQQGATPRRARTLGELELMSAKVDTRYSLGAKIFGWGEKTFWKKWYNLYKLHFEDGISEKVIRLSGVFGPEFRTFQREDIITKHDFDLKIESEALVNARKAIDRSALGEYLMMGTQLPGFNVRYALKEFGRLSNFSKGKIDQLLPMTYDEITAEHENAMINEGKVPRVLLTDKHMEHIAIHAKAKHNSQRDKHIEAHQIAIRIIHEHPELFDPGLIGEGQPHPVETPQTPDQGGRPMMPGDVRSPGSSGSGGGRMQVPESYQSTL
jgi:hypothetical protein